MNTRQWPRNKWAQSPTLTQRIELYLLRSARANELMRLKLDLAHLKEVTAAQKRLRLNAKGIHA